MAAWRRLAKWAGKAWAVFALPPAHLELLLQLVTLLLQHLQGLNAALDLRHQGVVRCCRRRPKGSPTDLCPKTTPTRCSPAWPARGSTVADSHPAPVSLARNGGQVRRVGRAARGCSLRAKASHLGRQGVQVAGVLAHHGVEAGVECRHQRRVVGLQRRLQQLGFLRRGLVVPVVLLLLLLARRLLAATTLGQSGAQPTHVLHRLTGHTTRPKFCRPRCHRGDDVTEG